MDRPPLLACRACRCLFVGAAACPLCQMGEHVVPHTEWIGRRMQARQVATESTGGAAQP